MTTRKRMLSQGFALPTVVITSVVMFALLIAATGVVSSTTNSLNTQFYEALAADVAESGANHASSCLYDSNLVSTWGSNRLYPNTSCSGGLACTDTANCYVVKESGYTTTYEVGPATDSGAGIQTVTVTGTVNLLRESTGDVRQSFKKNLYIRVGGDIRVSQVVLGYTTAGAFFATIGRDGIMRAAGLNDQGQLGSGNFSSVLIPNRFLAPTTNPIVAGYTSFLSGGTTMFAVDSAGNAYGAGRNTSGQLGTGVSPAIQGRIATPQKVVLPAGKKVRYITTTDKNTYFVTTDNNVYAAGSCSNGLLGNGYSISGCSSQSVPVRVSLPVPNNADPNTIPTDNIVSDRSTTYIRMAGGRVYGWGDNDFGQLGDSSFIDRSSPIQIGTFGNTGAPAATKIVTDGVTLFVLSSESRVSSVGLNDYGEMGTGVMSMKLRSTTLCMDNVGGPGPAIRSATCNGSDTQKFTVRDDGTIYNANANMCLQVSNGSTVSLGVCDGSAAQKFTWDPGRWRDEAQIVHNATGRCVNNVNIGAIGTAFNLASCGYAESRLFSGLNFDMTPLDMTGIGGTVTDIATDQWTISFLTSEGDVWSAGVNTSGMFGNGTTGEYQAKPVRFNIPSKAKALYTTNVNGITDFKYQNLFVVSVDGRVYGAGSNEFGQLGNGTTDTLAASPVGMRVINTDPVPAREVKIGLGTAVIFADNGFVYTVGNNANGQLGDGTTVNRSIPIKSRYINYVNVTTY